MLRKTKIVDKGYPQSATYGSGINKDKTGLNQGNIVGMKIKLV